MPEGGLRVLQVDKFLRRFGGAAGYMLDLGHELERRGHVVEYFAAHHPDNLPATYTDLFPIVTDYDPPPSRLSDRVGAGVNMIWSRPAARAMEAVIDDYEPDVVHLHNIYHQLSPSILRPIKKRGIPMVMTLHDFKLICPTYRMHDRRAPCEACLRGGFHHAVARRCKSGSTLQSALLAVETASHRVTGAYDPIQRLISPSEFLLEKLVEAGFDRSRIEHLPNFTTTPISRGWRPRSRAVLSVGRLSAEKGIDTLIRACALPPARELRIAGDGPLAGELGRLARAEAPDTTVFLGQLDRDSVISEIDGARLVAFPARGYENMPLAIIEAMARGVPVVVTDIGGSPELVAGERGGLAVAPDDPVALRRAIDRLDDDDVASELGASGAARVAGQFHPDVHLTRIEALYRQVIAGESATGEHR